MTSQNKGLPRQKGQIPKPTGKVVRIGLHLFVFLGLVLFHYGARGQSHYFRHYQVEEGLSNNTVFSIIQDHKGFMWFGTRDGLSRFDGYSFKTFKSDLNSPASLESNFIRCLAEDHEGQIWIGTDQGIYLFDPVFEKFEALRNDLKAEILDIQLDKMGAVWFISDLKLYKYQPQTGFLTNPLKQNNISSFYSDSSTPSIWVGTIDGEIIKLSLNGKKEGVIKVAENATTSDQRIEKIYPLDSDNLILGTRKQGIKLLHLKTKTTEDILEKDYKNESIYVRDIIHHKDSEFWFATESGIITVDFGNKQHNYITKKKNNDLALSDNAVYTLLKDKEGSIWAGTFFGGVNYYSKSNSFFKKYFPNENETSITGYAVREIVEDQNGKLWIGTEDHGLSQFDPQKNNFKNYLPSNQPHTIAYSNIHGLLASGDTLWVGTFEHGVDLMNINTGKVFKHYDASPEKDSLQNNFILNILKTQQGKILLATGRGIYSYEASDKRFQIHTGFPDYIFYTTLFEDREGVLWAGTWRDGLYYYDTRTHTSGKFTHRSPSTRNLLSNRINRIYQDGKGNIWIASEGGLSKYCKAAKTFEHFTTQEGLPSNLIFSILEDEEKTLWVSTSKGMVRFDPEKNTMTVLTKENGLLSNQFNYNSSYRDQQGNLYFGSVKGLVRFNPLDFPKDELEEQVYITGIQIQDREVKINSEDTPLDSAINFTKKIILKPRQTRFSLDFSSLSYINPNLKEYAYKMEGLDKDWTFLKSNRRVYFTNLPPGNYNFRVNRVNNSEDFIGKEAQLAIEVLPVFWLSNPALLFYAGLIILILFLLVRNYDQRVKKKNRLRIEYIRHQREKNLYQAKINFFTSVVHEIRTPLSLIKAPLERVIENMDTGRNLRKNKKYLSLIQKNTDRLLFLSNQLLDFRKVEADRFRLSFKIVNLRDLTEEIYNGFRAFRKKQMKISIQQPSHSISIETDEEALEKILSNLINNAIKYGDQLVTISLDEKTDQPEAIVKIGISSDGQRIPESLREKIFEPFYRVKEESNQRGTGIGLPLARSLAELLGGTLNLEVTPDGLNVFILTLPKTPKNHEKG